MATLERKGSRRRACWLRALAGCLLVSVCASCADCFFTMRGHVVECGTSVPVAGASVSVRIDEGIHGPRTLGTTFTTDQAGMFKISTDGSEVCSATATLTITKDGFMQLQQQFEGAPNTTAELCLTHAQGAGP
jgi:hypothetical protein